MENFFSSESLGVLAIGLTIAGILKLIVYYKAFNVAILRYLEPSEVIVLFADNVSIAAGVLLLLLAPYFYSMLPFMQGDATKGLVFTQRLVSYFHLLSHHFVYQSLIAVAAILFTLTREKITRFERYTYVALAFAVILILPLITLEVCYWAKPEIEPRTIMAFGLVANFIVIVLLATYNEIRKVKVDNYFACTTVEFEDGIIHPIGAYFIGKVKSFIFFYHPSDGKSIAYSTSKLKCINYKPYVASK